MLVGLGSLVPAIIAQGQGPVEEPLADVAQQLQATAFYGKETVGGGVAALVVWDLVDVGLSPAIDFLSVHAVDEAGQARDTLLVTEIPTEGGVGSFSLAGLALAPAYAGEGQIGNLQLHVEFVAAAPPLPNGGGPLEPVPDAATNCYVQKAPYPYSSAATGGRNWRGDPVVFSNTYAHTDPGSPTTPVSTGEARADIDFSGGFEVQWALSIVWGEGRPGDGKTVNLVGSATGALKVDTAGDPFAGTNSGYASAGLWTGLWTFDEIQQDWLAVQWAQIAAISTQGGQGYEPHAGGSAQLRVEMDEDRLYFGALAGYTYVSTRDAYNGAEGNVSGATYQTIDWCPSKSNKSPQADAGSLK